MNVNEYADMLDGILNPKLGYKPPLGVRLGRWLGRHNRKQLAKRIAALTGFSPTVVYLVLISARDDLFVTRHAIEQASASGTRPVAANVEPSQCRWVPTLDWERVRLEAQVRAAAQIAVNRLVEKRP